MRNKVVKVNGKDIFVVEKKVKELRDLSKEVKVDFNSFLDTDLKEKNTNDIVEVAFDKIVDKVTVIFPTLTVEDIEEAYMSEIEGLVEAFIEVNFTGLKKVFGIAMTMM